MEFITIVAAIIVLFFLILIIKQIFPKKLKNKTCALCLAVIITWLSLLVLYWSGRFDNLVIISLLMGGSILGIFYTIERNVKKDLTLFRLPFFLTLLSLGYFLLTLEVVVKVLILLFILWFVFLIIYLYRKNKNLNSFVKKIVECCKKW
jgi:hypothetical protein